jgi:hypothetical protein
MEPDNSVGDWQPVMVDMDYYEGTNVEYYSEVEFESYADVDTEWMIKAGLPPEDVGIFILALNQDSLVKREFVRLMYVTLLRDRSALSTYTFPITVGEEDTYTTLESVVEDEGNIAASFPLNLKASSDDVYSKKSAAALEVWLTEFDNRDTANEALETERGEIFIKKVLQRFKDRNTNENKQRMKVRMLRG